MQHHYLEINGGDVVNSLTEFGINEKGESVITLKLRSGAGGFCFWANMSEEGMDLSGYRPGQLAITQTSWLYDDGRGLGWNYFYTYW